MKTTNFVIRYEKLYFIPATLLIWLAKLVEKPRLAILAAVNIIIDNSNITGKGTYEHYYN